MYEIESGSRIVNNVRLTTYKREITNANIISVEAGTTGLCGGDSGHGGRTYFRIDDLGGTCMYVNVDKNEYGDATGFEIELEGDAELDTFIKALKFATKVLEDQKNEVYD